MTNATRFFIDLFDRVLRCRHADWRPADDREQRMKRWNGSAWEFREMTADEANDAAWWQAIR